LGKPITQQSIGFPGVMDITDVIDNEDNQHGIGVYLRSPKIAAAISKAIDG